MSRIFPTQFGAPLTARGDVDSDDPFLVTQDGFIKPANASAVRPLMLPTDLVDAADFTGLAESVIAACDATTGWAATSLHSGTITVDTVKKTTGTGSITASLQMDVGQDPKLYFTPTSPLSIAGRSLVALDVYINEDGPGMGPRNLCWAYVADGAALAGNVQAVNLGSVTDSTWTTIVLPLSGLNNITSIGFWRIDTRTFVAGTERAIINIDNVRFLSETKLDVAVASSPGAVAWVPPTYTPDANQEALTRAGAIDARLGVWPKQNNVIWLHDHLAHVVGAETGLTDVAFAVGTLINTAPPGSRICAAPGAVYRFDHDMEITNHDITIDFTDATCFLTYQSNTPFIDLRFCDRVRVTGGMWLGYKTTVHSGSNMENIAGTPTISGTTKLLDAQNEEVQLLDDSSWAEPYLWARVVPQQVGIADDGLGVRNYWSVVLSDTAQVANDWIVTVYSGDTTTVLAQQTLTVTSTPTAYPIQVFPNDVLTRLRLTVKKATATANTGTVTSVTSYGRNDYSATYDVASAFIVTSSQFITIDNMWIEGFGGDAIQLSDSGAKFIYVRNVRSHGMRRQGMSFNQGSDIWIENVHVSGTGRSGIDFEPFATTWFTQRVTLRQARFDEITNYAFAMGNWARNMDFTMEDIVIGRCRIATMSGGFRRGTIRNLTSNSQVNTGEADMLISGQFMVVENIKVAGSIRGSGSGNTFDDGTGAVSFAPMGNVMRNVFIPVGTSNPLVDLLDGWDIHGVSMYSAETTDYTSVANNAIGPMRIRQEAATADFSGVHIREWHRQFPNTFKAPIAHSSVWMPNGWNHYDDPVYNARSLSGGATRGNNLRGLNVALAASVSTHAVTFPARTVGTLTSFTAAATNAPTTTPIGAVGPGTMAPGTYYYRVAPRGYTAGPGTFLAQQSATLTTQTAAILTINGLQSHPLGLLIAGITVLRGTTTGVYDTRWDIIPNREFFGLGNTNLVLWDVGPNMAMRDVNLDVDRAYGFPLQTAATVGASLLAVDQSGNEPDANFDVWVTTNWNSGTPWITGKTAAGFTINFPNASPSDGSGRASWLVIR